MGKGKGSLARYCSRVLQNHNIMEFLGFSYREIMTLRKIFFKKVKIPVKIYSNFFLEKHHFVCGKLESNMNIKKYKKQILIIKSTYRSHFKLKKSSNTNSKTIFLKNMFIFILFSRTLIKNCKITTRFFKKNSNKVSVLKAPSRHKKFFHHIYTESFFLKITFSFLKKIHFDQFNFQKIF